MSFAATWLNLEIIILNEVKNKYILHLYVGSKKWYNWTYWTNKFINIENILMVTKGDNRGRGEGG